MAVIENTPHRRAIPEHDLARRVFNWRVLSRGQAEGAAVAASAGSIRGVSSPWGLSCGRGGSGVAA